MRESSRFVLSWAIVGILSVLTNASAQKIGSWRTFFSYNQVSQVIETKDRIFALSNGLLFSVDTEYESLQTYTKIDGLNDGQVANVAYDKELDILVITYTNSNIDLLKGERIENISDLMRKEISGKNINSITTSGRYAYLSMGLGIVVVDMSKNEIADTYVIGDKGTYLDVMKVEVVGNKIYAQTIDDELRVGSLNNRNLADFSQWQTFEFKRSVRPIKAIERLGNQLMVVGNDSLYVFKDSTVRGIVPIEDYKFSHSSGDHLLIADDDTIYNYAKDFSLIESYPVSYCVNGIYSPSTRSYWLACSKDEEDNSNNVVNLCQYKNGSMVDFYSPKGPESSSVSFLRFQDGRLITGSGGKFDLSAEHTPGVVQIYENGVWRIIKNKDFDGTGILEKIQDIARDNVFENVLDAVIDPNDTRRLYVASWRSLFEFYDYKPVQQYWYTNSPLVNVAWQTLVDGLCFDKDGTLWMLNMLSPTALVSKSPEGEWNALAYSQLDNMPTLKELFISKNGFRWVIAPRKGVSLTAIDPKNTPNLASDDRVRSFTSFTDADGKVTTPSTIRCIAEDLNGVLWVGTSEGPFLINNIDNVFDNEFRFNRIKIPRQDNEAYADYLLGSDQINAIVVDPSNRKWIGTSTSGLYLLSADGKETIHKFTTENSPLTSNVIIDLALDDKSGMLYIATSQGIFLYQTDVSEPAPNLDKVIAYPNPVPPDYDDEVIIKNLASNTLVRIADAEGHAVYEGYSNGGTFVWDGKNIEGKRVATGVYFVFCSLDDGSMRAVTKIAFIR